MTRLTHLSRTELEHLKGHKYARADPTLLEPLTDPFFEIMAKLVPRSITPNQLTVSGFSMLVISALTIALYNPDLNPHTTPNWIYLVSSLGVMLPCLMDAIDGKHARNTKQCSVVGHWLDHGFDAMNMGITACMGLLVFGGTFNFTAVVTLVVLEVNWFAVWWEESVTGTVRFPFIADVEGAALVTSAGVFNFFFGASLWHTEVANVGGFSMTVSTIGTNFVLITNGVTMAQTLSRVLRHTIKGDMGTKIHTARVIFPCVFNVIGWLYLCRIDPSLMTSNKCIWLGACGASCAIVAIRLIMTTLIGREYSAFQPVSFGVYIMLFNQLYNVIDSVFLLQGLCIAYYMYYLWTMCSLYYQIYYDIPWALKSE